MKRRGFLRAGMGALLLATARAGEVIELWNGRDLQGWQRGGRGIWTVEDGAIVGRFDHQAPGPGYLMTEAQFQDFRLNLEFWISPGGNSGVYVREPQQAWGHQGDARPAYGAARGYEIQIDYNDKKNFTGSVYNIQPATRLAGAENRWNRMEVECRGPRIRVWVGGEMVNDYPGALEQAGVVGLQVHGGKPHDHVVKFRALRVEVL